MIKDVFGFNQNNLGIVPRDLDILSQKEWTWLKAALLEEVEETEQAWQEQDIAKFVDGIIDLCYFAIGGLYRSGLTHEQAEQVFMVIHNANLTKKPGIKTTSARPNDGAIVDAVKPTNFVDPVHHIREILFGGQ